MNLLTRFWRQKFHRCGDSSEKMWTQLQAWYGTPMGRHLQELENRQLEQILPNLFGYHLVQVGYTWQDLTISSRVSHRLMISAYCHSPPGHAVQLCAQSHQLPIASDSVDVVVLPHVLEFSHYPHEVLREVDRILVPEGHVVMLCFNPFSLWNGWRVAIRWRNKMPWCGEFLSSTRLRDWLALLGFDTAQQQGYAFMPPWNSAHLAGRLQWLEQLGQRFFSFAAGSYVLVAKKRVTTLTPIRPGWRRRRQARWVTTGLVERYTSAKNQRKVS